MGSYLYGYVYRGPPLDFSAMNGGCYRIRWINLMMMPEMDGSAETGLNVGALDDILKPVDPAIVKARVQNHIAL